MSRSHPGPHYAISLAALRERAFEAYAGWVRLGIGLAAASYGLIWAAGVLLGVGGRGLVFEGLAAVVALVSFALGMTGRLQLAATILVATIFVQLNLTTLLRGDLRGSGMIAVPAAVLAAGLLLGGRWAWAAALVSTVTVPLMAEAGAALGYGAGFYPEEIRVVVVFGCVLVSTAALVHAGLYAFGRILRKSEDARERYAQLVEDAPDGILALRDDRTIRDANPAACGLLSTTREEIRGKRLQEAMGSRAGERLSGWLEQVAETPLSLTLVLPGAEREDRTLEVTARRTQEDRGPGYQIMLRDISDRVALQERTAQMGRLFSEARTEILIFHRVTGMLVQASKGAREALGYPRDEELELVVGEICPTLDPEGLVRLVGRLASAGGNPVRERAVHRRRDGSVYPVECEYLDFVLGGEPVIVAFAVDIADRIRAEEEQERLRRQLEHAQRMEAVGQLAGGVAHDFNNLLTVMGACAESLRDEVAPDGLELVDELLSAQERGAVLTRQLLAFARKEVVQPETLRVQQILADMEVLARRVLSERIQLSISVSDDPWIRADRGQFEQVLVNLLTNSRDAMPRGGAVQVRVATVRDEGTDRRRDLPGPRSPGRVCMAVTDQGTGMDAATQARIFEPFFTTKDRGRGTGLGLATVMGIVTESGGEIEVDSAPGEGTEVRVYWPAAAPGTADGDRATSRIRRRESRSAQGRILLAEDNEAARSLLARLLRRSGYSVEAAADGEDAYAHFLRAPDALDLLVTDVVMPRCSGIQLADRLRDHGFDGPVLFISGYLDDHLPREGGLGRGRELLLKPFRHDELLYRVDQLLGEAAREV